MKGKMLLIMPFFKLKGYVEEWANPCVFHNNRPTPKLNCK